MFPPFLGGPEEPSQLFDFAPDGAATFKTGALVYYDTSTKTLKECGADPALIAGVACGDAVPGTGKFPNTTGSIQALVLSPETVVCMASAVAADGSHVGTAYGVVKDASGFWAVDTTDVVNTRVVVVREDVTNNVYYVRFLAANLQFDAIAS